MLLSTVYLIYNIISVYEVTRWEMQVHLLAYRYITVSQTDCRLEFTFLPVNAQLLTFIWLRFPFPNNSLIPSVCPCFLTPIISLRLTHVSSTNQNPFTASTALVNLPLKPFRVLLQLFINLPGCPSIPYIAGNGFINHVSKMASCHYCVT